VQKIDVKEKPAQKDYDYYDDSDVSGDPLANVSNFSWDSRDMTLINKNVYIWGEVRAQGPILHITSLIAHLDKLQYRSFASLTLHNNNNNNEWK